MKVVLWLKGTSYPIVYENVSQTYVKAGFYCLLRKEKVLKYPIMDIFRVEEEYPSELRASE